MTEFSDDNERITVQEMVGLLKTGGETHQSRDFSDGFRHDPLWKNAIQSLFFAEKRSVFPVNPGEYTEDTLERIRSKAKIFLNKSKEMDMATMNPKSKTGCAFEAIGDILKDRESIVSFLEGAQIYLGKLIPAMQAKYDKARFNPEDYEKLKASIGIVLEGVEKT